MQLDLDLLAKGSVFELRKKKWSENTNKFCGSIYLFLMLTDF